MKSLWLEGGNFEVSPDYLQYSKFVDSMLKINGVSSMVPENFEMRSKLEILPFLNHHYDSINPKQP